jgi:hypothetical protein
MSLTYEGTNHTLHPSAPTGSDTQPEVTENFQSEFPVKHNYVEQL